MNLPGVIVVAVTKNRGLQEIQKVLNTGITHIGENRVQEAKGKLPELSGAITKHFIGRLQTNKVGEAVRLFDVIQSVDSLKLARNIDRECARAGKILPILIQVNTSDEPQKGGVTPGETIELVRKVAALRHIQVYGLMTIAVDSDDKERVRLCFRRLKNLFDKIARLKIPNVNMHWLSMGMSNDYEIAIEEGANMVRLGRIIFANLP